MQINSTDLPLIKPKLCFDKSEFFSRNNLKYFVINRSNTLDIILVIEIGL